MFCSNCGRELAAGDNFCASCGHRVKTDGAVRHVVAADDGFSALIPPNNPALISYYTGIFSILLGFVLGPLAIVSGIMGLVHAKRHPEAKGAIHAVAGIVCGAIGLAIWTAVFAAVIGNR